MVSVVSLAFGYLIVNLFSSSANLAGDVCSTLFGSVSILTLKPSEVWICIVLSVIMVAVFIFFYNRIFALTFDEDFSRVTGTKDEAEMTVSTDNLNEDGDPADIEENEKNESSVDVDLTVLSSTMVYSEVYNMMLSPEDYIGKTVKMEGIYSVFYDEVSDKYYFACIIMDATACCSQGIEFELRDDYKYPDDYPEEGSYICVEGVFDTYMEGENLYCTLRDAELDSWTAGSIEEVR